MLQHRATPVQPSNRRWFISSRRESYVTGYRSDHWRSVWERGQMVAGYIFFCTDCATCFSHRCDPVSCERRCVGESLHERLRLARPRNRIESLTLWRRVFLIGCIQHAMIALGEPVIIRYGLIPVTLGPWSLLFSGTKFEYIVAAKPSYGWIPCLWNSS